MTAQTLEVMANSASSTKQVKVDYAGPTYDVDVIVLASEQKTRGYFVHTKDFFRDNYSFFEQASHRALTTLESHFALHTASSPLTWEFEKPAPPLVQVSPLGLEVQRVAEWSLRHFEQLGLVSRYERSLVTEKAVIYVVFMPHEQWSSESRRQILMRALELEEQFQTVVLFELRRERTVAEHS